MKRFGKCIFLLIVIVTISSSTQAATSVITFEQVPGDVPREGLVISDQFRDTHGVIFRFEDGSPVILAKVGPPVKGFLGPPNHSSADRPAANQNVGKYFLTRQYGSTPPPLLIIYDRPVDGVSGELLDVDNLGKQFEKFTIQIRGKPNQILDQKIISSRDSRFHTGDGIATLFSFSRAKKDIHSLRIVSGGNKRGFGIAFDNFSPSSAAPSSHSGPESPIGGGTVYPSTAIGLEDADVYQYNYRNWKNANFGAWGSMVIGSKVDGTPKTNRRVYVKFDASRVQIPAGHRVYLELTGGNSDGDGGRVTVLLYRVARSWREGNGTYHSGQREPDAPEGTIAWTHQPLIDTSRVWARTKIDAPGTYRFDITELMLAWQSNRLPNHGLVLIGATESLKSYRYTFVTSESRHAAKRPRLIVSGSAKLPGAGPATSKDYDTPETPDPVAGIPGRKNHTIVIDGLPSGRSETAYRIEVAGRLEQIHGKVEGWKVSVASDDRVNGAIANGFVRNGRDGFQVSGGPIRSIALANPSLAVVYVDGRQVKPSKLTTHTVIIDGTPSGKAKTAYRIEAAGTIKQVNGMLAGRKVDIQSNDTVNGPIANGYVIDGLDGFRVTGKAIPSIELTNPNAAVVYINGQRR
jgi:hypothetical protein